MVDINRIVVGPDGQRHSVMVPEDASDNDIISAAQRQAQQADQQQREQQTQIRQDREFFTPQPGAQAATPSGDGEGLGSRIGSNMLETVGSFAGGPLGILANAAARAGYLPDAVRQFQRGIPQGAVLDPVQGLGQLTGANRLVPQGVSDFFDRYRENVEGSTAGQVGSWTGTIGSMLVPVGGEASLLARGAAAAPKAARAAAAFRAGSAGEKAVRAGLAEERAGRFGYQGVRRAMEGQAAEATPRMSGAAAARRTAPFGEETIRGEGVGTRTASAPGFGDIARMRLGDLAAQAGRGYERVPRVLRGATMGAIASSMQPVRDPQSDFWSTKLTQAASGAAGGALFSNPGFVKLAATVPFGVLAGWMVKNGYGHIPFEHVAEIVGGLAAASPAVSKYFSHGWWHGLPMAARLAHSLDRPGEAVRRAAAASGSAFPGAAGALAGRSTEGARTFLRDAQGREYNYQD